MWKMSGSRVADSAGLAEPPSEVPSKKILCRGTSAGGSANPAESATLEPISVIYVSGLSIFTVPEVHV
ncbi:hypothetical protein DPMN_001382 [Dreissena polymorpha]|uniref:Uncharacterized protein n=1 Tax=Dreissena polymorpha TaxID=45954 RepID=A0A9D4MKT8_DREPO|nr:hypothetical protein DPMN_001382 [Dreissena polymorpha]